MQPPFGVGLSARVGVVIPCLDEEQAIGAVVHDVMAQGIREIVVVDGGSRDRSVELAEAAGARVIVERSRGYGRAVRSGIAALPPELDIVLFIDGDGSDRPEFIPDLIRPIVEGRAVFAHGSRTRGEREPGSLSPPQRLAGWLAGVLIHATYGVRFTDMSPYRAVRRDVLDRLHMSEETFGWNLEMLMRVASAGVATIEIPVGQRRRTGGVSKVSGNFTASVRAAFVIGRTFVRLAHVLNRPV